MQYIVISYSVLVRCIVSYNIFAVLKLLKYVISYCAQLCHIRLCYIILYETVFALYCILWYSITLYYVVSYYISLYYTLVRKIKLYVSYYALYMVYHTLCIMYILLYIRYIGWLRMSFIHYIPCSTCFLFY